jgi:hypothetical protein
MRKENIDECGRSVSIRVTVPSNRLVLLMIVQASHCGYKERLRKRHESQNRDLRPNREAWGGYTAVDCLPGARYSGVRTIASNST